MMKILVVDDEPDVALLIRQRFRKEIQANRIAFRFAANGVEALAALDEEPDIGIVLTDINMPEMDGLTLLTRLNGRGPVPKAVIVSAYGDMENIRTAMNRGAFDFVTKPIDFQDLQATIEKTNRELLLITQAMRTRDELAGLRRELEIAASIQRSLLPPERTVNGFGGGRCDLFATVRPAREVGGDFYDYFPIDDRRVGFLVADVSGKGVAAALFMAVSRTLLRAVALEGRGTAGCLERLNELLTSENEAGMFVTVCYGILDLQTGELEYAKGGHPPPLVVGPSGVRVFEMAGDTPIGLLPDQRYEARHERLAPGEFLVIYSDGVSEAMNEADECFSIERLRDLLEQAPRGSCQAIVEDVIAALTTYRGTAAQADDITVLTVRYHGD